MLRKLSKPCNVSIEEPLFPIHSIHGSSLPHFATYFNSNLCGYASESIAIIWNWTYNKYQYLIGGHNNENILSICFHSNGQFLITASLYSLCIWDIASSTVLYCCRFNDSVSSTHQSINNRNICHVTISKNGQYVLLITNTFILIYTFIINNNGSIELITNAYYEFIDAKDLIISLESFNNFAQQFVTLSYDQIQFWKFNVLSESTDSNIVECFCTKSIDYIEQNQHIAIGRFESIALDDSDHIYILGQLGSVILMDHDGNILSNFTAQHPNCLFSSIDIGNRYMVISTSKGAIEVWKKDTLSYIRSISYPAQLRRNLQYKISRHSSKFETQTSSQLLSKNFISNINKRNSKHKKPNQQITAFNCNFLSLDFDDNSMIVRYSDNCICVLQLMSSRLIRYNISHYSDITTICVSNNICFEPQYCHKDDSWIISSSKDQTLCIWKKTNPSTKQSKLRLKHIIDIRGIVNPSFSYMSASLDKISNSIYASCIVYGKGNGIIGIGDNFGYIRILNIKHSDYIKIQSISNVSSSKVKSLCFDVTQNLLLVHRANNEVTIFNTTKKTSQLIPILCIQKCVDLNINKESKCLTQKSYLLQHHSTWQNETDLQCWIGTTNNRKRIMLRTFHLNPLCTNLYLSRNLRNHPLRFENKVNFDIPEGVISDFIIHPSEEYVCIASSIGNIYLYHLLTAKLCTIIQCHHHCLSLSFDPSGLYLCCVLITNINNNNNNNKIKGGDQINIYQIGTQEFIGEINCIGNI